MKKKELFEWQAHIEENIHKVEHKSQLYKVIGETIFNMEFDFFAYGIRHTAPFNRPKTFIHSTYPEGWSEHYIAHNYVMIDPAVKHGSISNELFIWSEKAYQQSRSLWDDAQQTGICVGASMSSFLPYNALGVISVSRKDTKISEHEASLLTGKLRILGDLIRDTLIRLNDEELVTPLMSMPMSDREKEVLRWTADGKTSSEISAILGISDNTVNFHLKSIQKKLDAPNKLQAAAYAAALRLI